MLPSCQMTTVGVRPSAPKTSALRRPPRFAISLWVICTVLAAAPIDGWAQSDAPGASHNEASVDAGAGAEAIPNERPPADLLRSEIDALNTVIRGELPAGIPVQGLFEVDLRVEQDVALRIAALRTKVAPSAADENPPRPVAMATTDGVHQRATRAPPKTLNVEIDESQLRQQRDRLRLAFLLQPAARRMALLESDDQRARLQASKNATREATLQAHAAELSAESARNQALPFDNGLQLVDRIATSQTAVECATVHMFRYVHGRAETDEDACNLWSMYNVFKKSGGDLRELLIFAGGGTKGGRYLAHKDESLVKILTGISHRMGVTQDFGDPKYGKGPAASLA